MIAKNTGLTLPSFVMLICCLLFGNIVAAEVTVSPKLMANAESGNPDSQYRLGMELCCKNKDTKRAVAWLCRASKQNHVDAPYQLGSIYTGAITRNGKTDKSFDSGYSDLSFAYMWYTVAMAKGHEKATQGRSKLERRMTREQIMQGKRWATGWRKLSCPSV